MTLRHRIAAVAGLAVAVTVLIAAGAVFLAVRAQLHQQIDAALGARAGELAPATDPDHDDAHVCAGGQDGDRRFPAPSNDDDDARFGGAEGYVQILCADGTVVRPTGARSVLPTSGGARAIARSGSGEALDSIEVAGTHLRVLTRALPSERGAVQVARPLTEVDHALRNILIVLAVVAAAGIALAAGLGA